jgi:hypothetical protein
MQILFNLLLLALGIILIVYYFIYSKKNKEELNRSFEMVFLKISFPKGDSKEDKEKNAESLGGNATIKEFLEVMSHFYDSIHSIYQGKNRYFSNEECFSLEMVILDRLLNFYLVIPEPLSNLFEKQLTAFFPEVFIDRVEDYNFFKKDSKISGFALQLEKESMFPIRTYQHLGSDPLNTTINVMSKLEDEEGAVMQVLVRPIGNGWQKEGRKYAKDTLEGKEKTNLWNYLSPFKLLKLLFFSSDTKENQVGGRNTSVTEEQLKIMEEKNTKVGFETVIRVVTSAPTQDKSDTLSQLLKSAFAQYSLPDGNSLVDIKTPINTLMKEYVLKIFPQTWNLKKTYSILVSEELSSIFHFPNIRYNKSVVIFWQDFKIAPAPSNLPKEGVLLGINSYRGDNREIRISRNDRRRHFYLIGKSGTGKSTLLETCIKQDLKNGDGVCVVDPHGDLVENMLKYVPKERADDVIYFNPGDLDRPMGLNILEAYTEDQKEFMAQEALAIFIKMFGEEIMGPRLQNYFRNGALTLMADDSDPATLLDIVRIYTDDAYRELKCSKAINNAAVKNFWEQEYANTGQRERQEIVPYFAAKFGPFVTNMQIRNIIGQAKSGFDFRDVMDNQKILFVNLSKGKLGDLNAQLLGMIIVAKIQMAAMSRVDTPEEKRKDFYLYVDEFQNFVTDSFASILSEARKYRLNLIIAHQYISQITKMGGGGKGTHDDTTIRDAVFGNVGSMLCFKIGSADSEIMAKEFAPVFSEQDLINIEKYKAYIKLNIDNTTSRGFSMSTIYDQSGADEEAAKAFVQLSRLKYARDRKFVDREITRKLT